MPDYSEMMKKARKDTQCAMEVWSDTLVEVLGSSLESIYSKGSATKPWESHIDYVPTISDVDIHITIKGNKPLYGSSLDDFNAAVDISRQCEEEFIKRRPDHFHVPRMQVIETRVLNESGKYTPPRPQDILVLYGAPSLKELPSPENIRAGDLDRIFELKEYLDDMPRSTLDRTGLDWWTIIRGMTWRVSPSPVRILTQSHHDPSDVWSWNRTRIHKALLDEGYDKLAEYYYGFYDAGWRLFLSEFKGLEEFRETASNGYYVLHMCISIAERMKNSQNEKK